MATELLSCDVHYFGRILLSFCIHKTTRRGIFITLEKEFRLLLLFLTIHHKMDSVCRLNRDSVKHILFCTHCEDDISQQTLQE